MIKKYFACANSGKGFVNHFDEILSDINNIYIIKGNPGNGKSTIMKKIGDFYGNRGMEIEYILCSSDPDSLDGIVIKNLGAAIVDGTKPHIIEPEYPGINGEYICVSDICDVNKLNEYRNEIMDLQKIISEKYKIAYDYLKQAKALHDELEKYYIMCSDFNKMDEKYEELIDKINMLVIDKNCIE